MLIDKMTVDGIYVDKMALDEMYIDKMALNEIINAMILRQYATLLN
jgi:hypothetical protein